MSRFARCALLGLALMLSACITSLHPFSTDETAVFEPALLGKWTSENHEETWEFSTTNPGYYRLAVADQRGKGEFSVRLFRIDDLLFLDLAPLPGESRSELHALHTPTSHFVMLVESLSPTLRVSLLSWGGLQELAKSRDDVPARVTIDNGKNDKRIVFTAPTDELQRFLAKYSASERATLFDKALELAPRERSD